MKNGQHGEGAPLDRRQLFEHALGGLSALALLRGLSGCAADDAQPTPQGPQAGPSSAPTFPSAPSGAAGSSGIASPAMGAPSATPVTPTSAMTTPAATPSASPVAMPAMGVPATVPTPSAPRAKCDVEVTAFPNLADAGPATKFTRMDQSSNADWIAIGGATRALAMKVPDGILNLLQALDKLYVGYPISVLQHSLQTATRARNANASDDLVLCALCHDIGMAITVPGHSELSAAILRGYVNNNAYRVVRHHTEFEWARGGAPSGQPTDQRMRYQSQAWFADASRFIDEWESISYDPKFTSKTLKDFEPLVRSKFGNVSSVNASTSMDCVPKNGGMP